MAVTNLSVLNMKNARLSQVGAGLAFSVIDGTAGGQFSNGGTEMILIQNAEAATNTVTFQRGDGTPDATLTIPASTTVAFGPLNPNLYNDANGKATVKTGDAVNISVLVVKITGAENTLTAQ